MPTRIEDALEAEVRGAVDFFGNCKDIVIEFDSGQKMVMHSPIVFEMRQEASHSGLSGIELRIKAQSLSYEEGTGSPYSSIEAGEEEVPVLRKRVIRFLEEKK